MSYKDRRVQNLFCSGLVSTIQLDPPILYDTIVDTPHKNPTSFILYKYVTVRRRLSLLTGTSYSSDTWFSRLCDPEEQTVQTMLRGYLQN